MHSLQKLHFPGPAPCALPLDKPPPHRLKSAVRDTSRSNRVQPEHSANEIIEIAVNRSEHHGKVLHHSKAFISSPYGVKIRVIQLIFPVPAALAVRFLVSSHSAPRGATGAPYEWTSWKSDSNSSCSQAQIYLRTSRKKNI